MKSERIRQLEDIAHGYFFQKDWDQYFYAQINLVNENLNENNSEEALKNINAIDFTQIEKKRIRNLFIEAKVKCLIKSSDIHELKLWSKLFFDICVETKNFVKGLSYLELIDSKKIKSKFLNIYKADQKLIESTLESLTGDINVISFFKKNRESYLYSKPIRIYFLKTLLNYGKEKEFFIHALEEILLDPNDFQNIKKIIATKYDIDMEADLLSSSSDEPQELDELEKNVKFLISAGKIREASELLAEAEKKYPFENRISKIKVILKMRADFQAEAAISPIQVTNKNAIAHNYVNTNQSDEKYLKKWVELIEESELIETYEDIYVALYFLKFYPVNKFLIERLEQIDKLKKDYFNYLNICYLKVVNFFEMNEFYTVISEAEVVIKGFKLNSESLVCFMYMIAEAYRKLKMTKEARLYYSRIARLKTGYRLVDERLKELNI